MFAERRYEDYGSEEAWEAACKALKREMGYDLSLNDPNSSWKFAIADLNLMDNRAWVLVRQNANFTVEDGKVTNRKPRNHADIYVKVETPGGFYASHGFELRNSTQSVLEAENEAMKPYRDGDAEWSDGALQAIRRASDEATEKWYDRNVEMLVAHQSKSGFSDSLEGG